MRPGTPNRAVAAALWTLLATSVAPATADSPRRDVPAALRDPRRPEHRWRDDDSERSLAIERARAEIREDPAQKKFILFRYGLREQDLR